MRFQDIQGLESTKQKLVDAVHNGHVAHAQLFAGNEGSANLAMALALALALPKAGSSMPARMAMMAITTNSSIKVKASLRKLFLRVPIIIPANGIHKSY